MQYLHGSLKIDVVIWNTLYNTHIMIQITYYFQCISHTISALRTHIVKQTLAIPTLSYKPSINEDVHICNAWIVL
jgi:hypothetical protein